ncbi:MAG: hypothetical protein ACXVY9_07175 [Terriglobales bacterium]
MDSLLPFRQLLLRFSDLRHQAVAEPAILDIGIHGCFGVRLHANSTVTPAS